MHACTAFDAAEKFVPVILMELELHTGEEELIEEVFHYVTTKEYPDDCKEGRKRVIRRKAKQFVVNNGDFMYKHKRKDRVSWCICNVVEITIITGVAISRYI